MNIIQQLEAEQIKAVLAKRGVPEFGPGDTVKVVVKVQDLEAADPKAKGKAAAKGKKDDGKEAAVRLQAYEGVCIARSGHGVNESFTVRKISYGEGVERVFPIYSPLIAEIEVLRRGRVRRAKLYYLRGRRGRAARIFERTDARARKLAAAWKGFKKPKGDVDDLTRIKGCLLYTSRSDGRRLSQQRLLLALAVSGERRAGHPGRCLLYTSRCV